MVVASLGSYNVVGPKSEEKRIMLKKFLLFTIASLVMLPALAAKPPPNSDKGNKDGGGVYLAVEFRDQYQYTEDDPPVLVRDDKFGSDGIPPTPDDPVDPYFGEFYINGYESVSTHIDKFRFGLNLSMSPERNFWLDLTACDLGSGCAPPNGLLQGWNVFATSPDGAQYLKMSANGDDPDDSKPVNFQLEFFDGSGDGWRIMFNPSECPGTDMVTVTKTSDDPDTWEFVATEDERACLQFREGPRKKHYFAGLYSLPFLIRAQAIE